MSTNKGIQKYQGVAVARAMVDALFNEPGFALSTSDMLARVNSRKGYNVSRSAIGIYYNVLKNAIPSHAIFKHIKFTEKDNKYYVHVITPKAPKERRDFIVERWYNLYSKKVREYIENSEKNKNLDVAPVESTFGVALKVVDTHTEPGANFNATDKHVDRVEARIPEKNEYEPPHKNLLNDKTINTYSELLGFVQIKGGTVSSFTWNKLHSMSAAELIATIATNGIRFTIDENN